jgi:ferrous iron transport protein B
VGATQKKLTLALAGNANVGKSALFNLVSGMSQHVANWPGKTVELAECTLRFLDREITVVDLPGIYSLSAFSIEERVTQEYILDRKPGVVVNVVDSTALERNLFFTLQLLDLGVPMVVALNQADAARKRGMHTDAEKLGRLLGVPAVHTVATRGDGVQQLMLRCLSSAGRKKAPAAATVSYGRTVDRAVKEIAGLVSARECGLPPRYAALKLLEGDSGIQARVRGSCPAALAAAETWARRIEKEYGEPAPLAISGRRYAAAARIAEAAQTLSRPSRDFAESLDELTSRGITGYLVMLLVLAIVFYSIFTFGSVVSGWLGGLFGAFRPQGGGTAEALLWEGLAGGFIAGVTLVIPYVLPFYLLLSILEDTGYITRIAYLLEGIARRAGFHGKAIIPMILGYGCNVPACIGCRILEYDRDRLITAFAITLVPCTARTVVVLALVGAYLGPWWALGLYAFNIAVVALLAKTAFRILPGEPMGLIMEMPPYRIPAAGAVLKHTWWKIKSILTVVFPYYMGGGILFAVAYLAGVFTPLNSLLAPVMEGWLGLPAFTATLLLFGLVRKEFIVVLPAVLYGTADLSSILTPLQMVVVTLVAMFYMPCFATIEALRREFGMRNALAISLAGLLSALVLGGLAFRVLSAAGMQ